MSLAGTSKLAPSYWLNEGPPSFEDTHVADEFVEVKEEPTPVAVKFDTGKLDWSLMPWDSVEEILKVLEFGKQKYSAWNWAQGEGFKYSRIFNSLLRHMFTWFRGEDNDPESGLSHLAHAGCNVLFLIYFVKHKNKYNNNDDRHAV